MVNLQKQYLTVQQLRKPIIIGDGEGFVNVIYI